MATDSTNVPQTEASAGNDHQEFNPENIQLAQANTGGAQQPAAGAAPQADIPGVPNGSVNVAFPDGQNIVRVQVAPGETISIPFDGDLAAKFGEEGNLAIKVGDRTIILQGYAEANQETGVTLKDESGDDIDVASVIAATDPNLDIQTAAGGAAGGSVGGSGFFSPFTNAGELGGLGELGVLGQTELNYGLIQPDANILLQEPDTDPTLVSITFDITGGFVNEDDLGGGAPQQSNFAVLDIGGGHDIGGDLLARLGQNVGEGFWTGGWKDGNDAFDTDDHEAGSQTDSQEGADGDGIGVHSDDHNGVDQDREPTTAKATVTVDFHGDVPGKISFSNGTNVPAITQLANQHLTSHGHELQYALLPAANGQGEMIVAYYSEDGINHLVFTVGIEEASGATSVSAFHIDYTEYDAVDNVGDAADILNVGVPFFMSDSDGSVVAVPSGPNGLTFQIIDDVPELGHVQYGEDGSAQNIVHADLTIGHDESAHSQHTSYQGADGQTHHTDDAGYISADDANNMVKDGLAGNSAVSGLIGSEYFVDGDPAKGFNSALFIGAAQTYIDVSFGADGRAEGNAQAGKTIFAGDGDANSQAFEIYMQGAGATGKPDSGNAADTAVDHAKTNLTIDVEGKEVGVDAYQLDANTIVGIAQDGTPVFTLHLDPETGELTLTQYHQMHNADGSDANDPTNLKGVDAEGNEYDLIHFRGTDYDGDHVDGKLDISFIDDAPKVTCEDVTGKVAESALHDGNRDNPWQSAVATGSLASTVDFGADKDGTFKVNLTDAARESLENQHLTTHDGVELQYKVDGNGVLVGYTTDSHGHEHDVFTLEVDANGDFKFTLKDQIDHPGYGQDIKEIDFSGVITATDSDGDSVVLKNGQFEIKVEDDKPVSTCRTVDGTVDESALSDGNREGYWQHASTSGSLKNTVDFGADNHGKFLIDLSQSAKHNLESQGLSSHGQELHYTMQNGVLVGYTGSPNHPHVVFTLTVDSDGDYKFELKDQLDHIGRGNGDVIDIDFSDIIKATDEDGDSIHLNNGQFEVHVKDDQPVSTCRTVDGTVDESALSDGNRDNPWQTKVAYGHLGGTVDFGADNHGKFSIDLGQSAKQSLESQHLTSHGQELHYTMQGGTLVAFFYDHGQVHQVFTLTVDSEGNYKFELKDQLDHADHGRGDDVIDIDFSGIIKATDEDGDSIHLNNGQFEVHVKDDQPVATCNNVDGTVDESALSDGNKEGNWQHSWTAGSLKSAVDFGADNHGKFSIDLSPSAQQSLESQHLTSHGQELHYTMQGGTLVAFFYDHGQVHQVFTLTVDNDGNYKFELKDQLDHVGRGNDNTIDIDFSGIIKATDEDGDSIHLNNGQFEIHVNDDQPVATCNNVDSTVDESALSDGNRENPWQTKVAYGHLAGAVDFGADNHGRFSIDLGQSAKQSLESQHLTSHGQELHYTMQGGTLVAFFYDHGQAHEVFTLTVDSDGDYKFELKDQLDHVGRGNGDVIDIDFSGIIKATDEDGDSIHLNNGQFEVHVKDDQPVATCNNVDGTVDESALSDGNREGGWQHASTTGSLKNTVDFGADNHGKFSIDLAAAQSILGHQNLESHGQDLHYKLSDDGHTLIGYTGSKYDPHVVFTLTVDSDGDYKFELKDQLDHEGRGNDDVIDLDFSGIITATDEDGDSIHLNNGQFEIHVKDDQPVSTCRDVDGTVDESALSDGNREGNWQTRIATGHLSGAVDFGADNHGHFSIDFNAALVSLGHQNLESHGQGLNYMMQGDTLVGYTGSKYNPHVVFTLTVDSDGDYKFELKDQLDHKGPGNDNTIDIDFSDVIKATDEDGDSIHLNDGQFEIHVKDDQPVATCNNVDGTVDESALSDGNKEGNWQRTSTMGSLAGTVDFGADNHGKFSIDLAAAQAILGNQNLESHGQDLHYKMQGDTLVGYTGTANNPHVVFTLTVDENGNYKFDLKDQLDHKGPGNDNAIDLDFSGIITATDEDGDSIHLNNGQFEIHVKDDQPVSTCRNVDGTVDESALWDGNRENNGQRSSTTGSLSTTVDFGADNHGKFSIDVQTAQASLGQQHLQSHGQDLHYMMVGDTLVGYTGLANNPHVVFTLTVDSDGDYKFELKDQLDHKGPGNDNTIDIDFSGIITATDEDGDSIHLNNGQFEIHVKDDTPISTICVADHGGVTIDESAGLQENDKAGSVPSIFAGVTNHDAAMGWAQSTGPVVNTTVSFGADDKGSESLTLGVSQNGVDSGLTTTDGHHIFLFKEGNLVVGREDGANGKAAFALSMDASGKLTIVQYEPIHQNNPNDPNDAVHIKDGALQVTYTVTDGDGDSDSHTVNIGDTITFKDDGPSKFSVAFSGNDNTVDESALTTANPNDEKVTFHFNYQNNGGVGADGLQSVTFALTNPGLKTASGEDVHTQMVDGVLVGYTGDDPHANHVFTITDNHNGTYTFELDQPLQNNGAQNDQISLNLTATVTDGDGDSQSSNFTIKVNDDTPGTPCVVSHDPNFVFGEGRIDEDFLPTGNHDADTNPDNVGVGGVIFPGSHYDDMGGTTVGGSIVADYGADGPGGLSLTSLKVTSDAILGNTLLNVTIDPATHAVNGTNNLKASDGTPIQLVFDGTTLTGYAGSQHDAAHAVFAFSLNANGTWSYTLLQGLDHPIDTSISFGGLDTRPEDNLHFSFGVTATDKDGDAKTGYVNVNVDDDGPQAGNFTLGTFQEHSAAQDLGTVEHVFGGHYTTGADGLGNIQITDGNGAGHGTLTIVNGHVYYTPPANVTGDQSYNFEYTVTDGDGDRSTGKITVGVKDNVPTITHQDPYPNDPNNGNGELTLSESHLADGTQPDSNLLSKNGVFTIDTHGEGLGSIQINGNTVTDGSQIAGDKGTLVIDHITDNHDGTYSVSYHYTVDDNHLLSDPNDTFNQQFNITVKDASGDSASSTITVHVTDDAPIAGAPVTMTVDEDALDAAHGHNGSAGIDGGPGDVGDNAHVNTHASVALGVTFGADGKGSVTIDTSNLPQIKSDGHQVQYDLSPDGHTLTGYITYESEGHTTKVDVLTLTIDDNNQAIIDLLAPIDHPDHGQTGSLEDNSTLSFGYTVTDGDGDTASGQINVTVNDDTPTASCVTADVVKEPTDGGQTGQATYTIDTSHYDASSGNNTDNTLHISAGYVDANGNYVDSLPGHDGDAASVNVNGDSGNAYGGTTGFGASSGVDGDGQDRFDEVNYLGDSHSQTSEALVISLAQDGKVATSATVNLAEFYPNESNIGDEQGAYRLYLNGQPVSDWISFTAENANGSLGLTINGPASGFDKIVFAGLPATSNPNGDQNGSDSSDFSIHDATFNVVDADSIGGTVSSAHGGLPLQFGADGPGHVDLIAHEATGLQYNGQDITETVQNGVLYGKAGDTVIYTLSLVHDQNGYHYQFDLAKPIDGSQTGHPITFDYSVTDNDGDKVGGCITVNIDDNNGVTVNLPTDAAGVTQVDEAGLAAGTHHGDGSNLANGHIAVNAPDGVTSIKLGGVTIPLDGTVVHITDGTRGTLDAHWNATDHTIDYTYTLTGPTTEGSDDQASFEVVVTDPQGDHNTGQNLVITIHDDAPIAMDDGFNPVTAQIAAGQDIGNILTNDKTGADGYGSPKITSVEGGVSDGNGGFTISTTNQGTIHVAADGTVTFDSNTGHNYGSGETLGFDYTIQDGDGDPSTAHASFTVGNPSGPQAPHVSDLVVNESGLPNGSHQGNDWINTGTAFTLPDGYTLDPANIGLHQLPNGTLLVAVNGTTVSYAFELTSPFDDGTTGSSDGQNTVDNANSYTLHLTGPYGQSIDVPVNIDIVDDVPVATADVFGAFQAQTALGQDIGNILANDKPGADGYASQKITSVTGGVSDGHGGFTIANDKGTIHIAADGKVTFDANTGHNYGAGETLGFDYTIQDKDGDTSTAHASFTVGNPTTPNAPHASDLLVNESQLSSGTHQGGGSTTDGNSFTVPAGFAAQTGTFNLPHGTLTVTQTGNTVSYSYTLTKAVDDGTTGSSDGQNTVDNADTHTVHLTGPFGQTIDVTVNVDVKDDVPTAQHADLGSFDENSGAHIGHVDFNAGADGLQSVVVTEGNDGSQGTLSIDDTGKVTYTPPADINGAHDYTFTYEVTDKDGDKATNTITVHVNDTAKPVLIVGENVDDNSGQQKDHYIDHAPGDQNQGTINGGDAGDVLVGDVGGKSGQIAAGDYNICLILDVSTSMNDTFSGSGGKSRLDVMQAAVDELLAKYADHPGDVNIKIIAFGTDVVREWSSNANGDFTSTTTNNGQTAIQFVDGLDNRGTQYTNYEAAMAAAKAWFDQVGNNGNTNKAYFLSDGDPTARLNNSGDPTDIDASPSNSQVEQYLSEAEGAAGSMLGTGNDGLHVDFQAIGIGSGVTKTNLDRFDNSGDTQTPGDAQIVTDASQLNDALDVGKAPEPFAQGDDVINGGKGNDLIFGDEVYTESINDNNPNTIGWQNFGNMTEAEIVAWLKANPDEAGKEYADAKYGNDTLMGGEGDDVIYGQGGDDIITGGKGTDQLHGGSGNDTYIWAVGDGNDTIMETAGLKDTLKITGTDTNPTLTRSGNDLIVTIGGETITVKGQFETDGDNNPDTNKAVEFIEVNGQTYRVELDQNGQPKLTVVTSNPPVNTVPNSIVAVGTTTIPGVSVQDTDSQSLQVTLAVDHGVLAFASTLGLTVDYNGDHSQVTLSGDQAAINQALAGLQYTSDGHDATLTMVSKDSDGHTDTDHTSIHALTLDANLNLSTDHGNYGSTSYTGGEDYDASGNSGRHIVDQSSWFLGHYDAGTNVTIDAGKGNDWIEGGDGNDYLKGNGGNDYLDGGAGHDRFEGGDGNDVIKIDHDDLTGASRLIDGGAGDDAIVMPNGDWDFRGDNYGNTGHKGFDRIETLDLSGGSEQHITLDANSVLEMTDNRHTLVIKGDSNDHVTLDGTWNQVGTVTDHGTTYNVFQSGSGSNLTTAVIEEHIVTTHG